MSLKKLACCLGLAAACVAQMALAESGSSVIYENQRGSTLVLVWHSELGDTGALTGSFTTKVGNCPKDMNQALPIKGYYNGNALSVTVNYPHCKQVIAMTGNLSEDQNTIHMLWLDANQAKDANGKDWNSNIIGSDVYTKLGE